MSKTYNGLTVPILLFKKEGEVFTPQPNVQPSYGVWKSLDEAKEELIKEFESTTNVPRGYTFAIVNAKEVPEEWWFTEDGNWDTIAKKGVSLFHVLIQDGKLWVSYDGGVTWEEAGDVADIDAVTNAFVIRIISDPKESDFGTIKYSTNYGETWSVAGKLALSIENEYLYISLNGGTSKKLIGKVGGTGGSVTPTDQNPGGVVDNLNDGNIDDIDYQGPNDSEEVTYTGQDAIDLLVYLSLDDYETFNSILNSLYPDAKVGESIILRSTIYDRTGGMSNKSDGTHTLILDPSWTTQEILDNNSQDIWYHYYKVTKVEIDKWAALAWVGRVPQDEDTTVYYKLTIGTVNPADANVTVTYGGKTVSATSGTVLNIPEGTEVTINATHDGYNDYTQVLTPTEDTTVNIEMTETTSNVTITIGTATPSNTLIYKWDGTRVYPGDRIEVASGSSVWFYATCSGYNNWNWGTSSEPKIVTEDTTVTPVLEKKSVALEGGARIQFWERFYAPDGLSNDQFMTGEPDSISTASDSPYKNDYRKYFSTKLDGQKMIVYYEVYYNNEIFKSGSEEKTISRNDPVYLTISAIPVNSWVYYWCEIPDFPEYEQVSWAPQKQSIKANLTKQYVETYYRVSDTTAKSHVELNLADSMPTSPVNATVVVQGTTWNHYLKDDKIAREYTKNRHFIPGTTVSFRASCEGYKTKEWVITMPDSKYTPPQIVLETE